MRNHTKPIVMLPHAVVVPPDALLPLAVVVPPVAVVVLPVAVVVLPVAVVMLPVAILVLPVAVVVLPVALLPLAVVVPSTIRGQRGWCNERTTRDDDVTTGSRGLKSMGRICPIVYGNNLNDKTYSQINTTWP